jgi:hypothetical protein
MSRRKFQNDEKKEYVIKNKQKTKMIRQTKENRDLNTKSR